MGSCSITQGAQQGALCDLEGRGGRGREAQEGGAVIIIIADSCCCTAETNAL